MESANPKPGPGIGMPASLYLQDFGQIILDAFGNVAYHVGSSLTQKTGWRDVDIRLLLSSEEYEALGFGDLKSPQENPKWCALTKAFSCLGEKMTGLPIDFQIQQTEVTNEEHKGPRSALICLKNLDPRPYRTSTKKYRRVQ